MNLQRLRYLLALLLTVFTVQLGWSQGATTSAMNGVITDKAGAGLPGATVIAVHTPTNTQYVAPTNSEGRYNIQNMRVGGPYTVRITFIGYKETTRENIFLTLGQNLRLDVNLNEATTELAGVTVQGTQDRVINAGRTGAETTITREQIQRLPTLSRSLNDFTRLNPQANGGGSSSIGGSNNRYNNITIDGAVNNDVFGLAGSGTPGGQAGTTPISLDAIQEIQVVVAPYDVTLGNFTGGGVNAVTRSGTNEVSASIYGFGRNQNSVGKSVTEPRTKADEFYNYQTGFRVGGALVKDKAFFFLNAEIARNSTPLAFEPGSSTSRIQVQTLDSIANFVKNTYNYDVGSFGSEINRRTESNKIFARLDFNLTPNNQLTVRHNFVKAFDDNITRSSNQMRFGNNAYQFSNVTNSSVLELNSRLDRVSNKLLLSYSRIRDERATPGSLFPTFEINDKGNRYTLGTERSSAANSLDQDILEITDNVTSAFGKHTLTLGTHNEFFKFRNLFINNGNGYYNFSSLRNFYAGTANNIQAAYATADNGEASFSAAQLGVYLQDQFSPVENLRLTAGIRLDVPVFFDKPQNNTNVEGQAAFAKYGNISTQNVPSGQLLFAPRLGFNWDVNNDAKTQLRGGTGIFTGRVPFVWISNSYTNSGLIQGSLFVSNPVREAPGRVLTDISRFPTYYANGAAATTQINLLSDDFKLPQVWRSNLAVDFRLPGDIVATLEGIYSKTINDIYYRDINLQAPVGRLAGPDQRPIYGSTNATRLVDQRFTNVYLLDNTSKGYRYSATAQLQKNFTNGLNSMVAYTYGMAKEVNSGSSSTADSNFGFNQIAFDPNNPELGFSRNDQRHRILATAGYTLRYGGDRFATGLSMVYEGLSGAPISYVYNSDLNFDRGGGTRSGNDLIYVPRDVRDTREIILVASENRTLAQVQDQLDAFIENDPYLRTRRGQVVERFGARMPFTHQFDARVTQDFNFTAGGKKNTIQLTFDVINVGNLLNNSWGRQYSLQNNASEILRVSGTPAPNVQPSFTFPASFAVNNRSYDIAPFASRWQGQLGVRYIFN
ncbi:carboxypeptidase regulatory-like domain-containing protein [Hymenobacter sp. BT175]|uniref:TonB-dependent receptor n=1 Tax=Hymenobacter translucens TaxID=2886507 RepID=UPI001D0E7336|nr:carboxypeptidase regulatory-like domain-containing protein [Hymenobacter translucens]MCC2547936.1 carboxypeptidase regulatory-like domain-containing protein [Hymenobacter translucens]